MRIFGVNPVVEALRAHRVTAVTLDVRGGGRLPEVRRQAAAQGVPVEVADRAALDRLVGGQRHQGVVATVATLARSTVAELVAVADPALVTVLDGIEDPHNLGAVARVAEAAGAAGLVVQTRRAAPITAAAIAASAGALAHLPVAPVVNVARAVDELRAAGVWVVGLDGAADRAIYEIDLTVPVAIVVGAEGQGLRRLVRARCDWLAALPMRGRVESLNASVAAGIALFEVVRQRRIQALAVR